MRLVNIAKAGAIEDSPRVAEVLLNMLSFLLQVFGFIGIIALVVAGLMYLTAGGSEQRIDVAKKYLFYSIVGIIVALSGLIIIRQITSFFQ
jgi:hypothetical protein